MLPAALVVEIRGLLHHHTHGQTTGQPSRTGTVTHVRSIQRLETQRQMLRKKGMLTTARFAEQLPIRHDRVRCPASRGMIRLYGSGQTRFLYEPPGQHDPVREILSQSRNEAGMAHTIQRGVEA